MNIIARFPIVTSLIVTAVLLVCFWPVASQVIPPSGGGDYNPATVAITGGSIDGTTIGGTTAAAVTGTNITAKCAGSCSTAFNYATGNQLYSVAVSASGYAFNGGAYVLYDGTHSINRMEVDSSGNFGVGGEYNGTACANPFCVSATGYAHAASLIATGTTSVSGCSLTAAVGGTLAGQFKSGTSGTCTVTITPGPTAPNGWFCFANDLTTTADKVIQTGSSTTTCTVAGTTVSADVINWTAIGY